MLFFLGVCAFLDADSDHLRMAYTAHHNELYEISNSQIDKFLESDTDSEGRAYAFLLKSSNYIKLGRFSAATELLEKIKSDYSDSRVFETALAYLVLTYLKQSDTAKAVESYSHYKKHFEQNESIEKQLQDGMLSKAVSLFNEGSCLNCQDVLNLLIKEFPGSQHIGLAFYYKGLIYFQGNDFENSIYWLSRASDLSGRIEDENVLADILLKTGDSFLNLRKGEKAEGFYLEVIDKFKTTLYSEWAYFQLAVIERRKGNLHSVLELLKNIQDTAQGPLRLRVVEEIASVNFLLENWAEAEHHMEVLIKELGPKASGDVLADIYVKLGSLNFNMQKYERSVEFFQKALHHVQNPGMKEQVYYGLGYTYYRTGALQKALNIWARLIKEFPESSLLAEVLFLKGSIYYEQGEYAESERVLKVFLKEYKGSASYVLGARVLVEGLIMQEKYEEAKRVCEEFFNHSEDEVVSFNYGKALFALKEFKKAEDIFQAVETTNPSIMVEVAYYLGQIYIADGKKEDAQERFLHIITFYQGYTKWVELAREALEKLAK